MFAFSSLSYTNLAADCPAGSYSSLNRTCILCPRGTYQPSRGRPSCISCGLSLTTHSSGTVDKKHCISKLINSNCNISCGVRHILVNWCSFSLNSAVALLTVDGNSAFSNVRCNIFSGLSYRRQIIHFQIVLELENSLLDMYFNFLEFWWVCVVM